MPTIDARQCDFPIGRAFRNRMIQIGLNEKKLLFLLIFLPLVRRLSRAQVQSGRNRPEARPNQKPNHKER